MNANESAEMTAPKAYDIGFDAAKYAAYSGRLNSVPSSDESQPYGDSSRIIRGDANVKAFDEGTQHGAAQSLSEAVHRVFVLDAQTRAGDQSPIHLDPRDSENDLWLSHLMKVQATETPTWEERHRNEWKYDSKQLPTVVESMVIDSVNAVNVQNTEKLLQDPAAKDVLPHIAMVELQNNFDTIHDSRAPGGITLDELKATMQNCNADNDLLPVAAAYAIKHFDKLSQLDQGKQGITQEGLAKGIAALENMELAKYKIDPENPQRQLDKEALDFLSSNFGKIQDPRFSGISKVDLRRYFSQNCSPDLEKTITQSFDRYRKMDPNDGERSWTSLWLMRNNSDTITASDVRAGLKSIAQDTATMEQIKATMAGWVE